ncbi:hypothetical protein JXA48_03405 [Candidatus Woesearchaeota archaeon]|nr:hypothetical protein [Candidatus Woesearchaeota archaeon]
MAVKKVLKGTLRIKTKDLQLYEKTDSNKDYWKRSDISLPEAKQVIHLFKSHKNLKLLVDSKDSRFLKGQLYKNKIQGERIKSLPNGQEVDKAYSLFSPHLNIHDQTSNEHWDVIFMNPNGSFSYIYTLNKKQKSIRKKYTKVKEFENCYPKLKRNVLAGMKNNDEMAILIYTLLKTHMRVGNEIYFKLSGHKGLTTLTKKDISIDGNKLTFNYLAKDGVPITITENFPETYVKSMKSKLSKLKSNDFVFATKSGHPIHEEKIKLAFKKYCGVEFYPHIIRSYYATTETKKFLELHKKPSKDEVRKLFLSIAKKLGHKKFSKKHDAWEENFTVTLNHYVDPSLVKKIKKITN